MFVYKLAQIFDEKSISNNQETPDFQKNINDLNENLSKQGYQIELIKVTPDNINEILENGSINGVVYSTNQLESANKKTLETLIREQSGIDVYPTYQNLEKNTQKQINIDQKKYIESINPDANICPIVPGTNSHEIEALANTINLGVMAHCNSAEKVSQTVNEKASILVQTVQNQTFKKHEYTSGHIARVASYSHAIGEILGLSSSNLEELDLAALLHDIGKVGIVDNVLAAPHELSNDEKDTMGYHDVLGTEILKFVRSIDPDGVGQKLNANVLSGAEQHHKPFDGYNPRTKQIEEPKGENINLFARIINVADSIDAMTSQRAYNNPKDVMRTVEDLWGNRGKQFDPQIAEAAIMLIAKEMMNLNHNFSEFWPENSPIKQFLVENESIINSIQSRFLGSNGIDKDGHFILEQDSYNPETAQTGLNNDIHFGILRKQKDYLAQKMHEENPSISVKEAFEKINSYSTQDLETIINENIAPELTEQYNNQVQYELNVGGKRFNDALQQSQKVNENSKTSENFVTLQEIAEATEKKEITTSEVVEATRKTKENIREQTQTKESMDNIER